MTESMLTVVMYHYVRDMTKSAYPSLKALNFADFKQQIEYFENYYRFVTVKDVIEALYTGKKLPRNAILLTFDDGYSDHYEYVLPVLREKRIQGCFFAPGRPIVEKVVLPVNKIQFLLAAASSVDELLSELYGFLDLYSAEFGLLPIENYYSRLAHADYFDTKEVVFVKKMLSMELPMGCRERILNAFFSRYITEDETSFAEHLYLSRDQLKEMIRAGMYIGCHGYNHLWLAEVSRGEQEKDIDRALDFLEGVDANIDEWALTYPYESYNHSLIEVIAERGCKLGFIEEENIAHLDAKNAFTLFRLDTNEFPKAGDGLPNKWSKRVVQ